MSRADDLRAELAGLEEEERLEQALADAGAAYEAAPEEEKQAKLAAHNAAAEALVAHRQSRRPSPEERASLVAGDATVQDEGEGEQA